MKEHRKYILDESEERLTKLVLIMISNVADIFHCMIKTANAIN
jgi:hypothetical protein